MNASTFNRFKKTFIACLALLVISTATMASSGTGTIALTNFKNELLANLDSEVLKSNGLETAAVLVTFTVTEDSSIHIINLASHEQPIKEYMVEVLEGHKATSDLKADEIYQILIRFERL